MPYKKYRVSSPQQSLLTTAHNLLQAGFSLIPCRKDKRPAGQWREYTIRRPNPSELRLWFEEFTYPALGIICGQVSDNLVVVDLDGIPAIRKFATQFPDLCQSTYSVLTGSQEGIHLYFRVKKLSDNLNVRVADVGGFELRGNGQYVIAPPSLHPSGKRYLVYRDYPILERESMQDVYDWMTDLRQQADRQRLQAPAKVGRKVTVNTNGSKRAYLETVVSQELYRVTSASSGNRNSSLFYASLRLANLAAGGELSWSDMQNRLLNASQQTNPAMNRNEAERTIASAWRIGSQRPRRVS